MKFEEKTILFIKGDKKFIAEDDDIYFSKWHFAVIYNFYGDANSL